MPNNLYLLSHLSHMFVLWYPSQCHIAYADASLSFFQVTFCLEYRFYLCPTSRILITIFLILIRLHLNLILNLKQFSGSHCSFNIKQNFSIFLIRYLRQEFSSVEYCLSKDIQKALGLTVYHINS